MRKSSEDQHTGQADNTSGDPPSQGAIDRQRRAVVAMLAGATAGPVAGCVGGSENGATATDATATATAESGETTDKTTITFRHTARFEEPAAQIRALFEEKIKDIVVKADEAPGDSAATRDLLIDDFTADSQAFDTTMMDVIWPAEFVASDWIASLEGVGVTEQMLETPVEANTVDGELYGVPLFTDANVLYYRSDKLDEYGFEPPETYTAVIDQAQTIMAKDDEIEHGYLWQGGANEGLTIMWLNWLWGMGGDVRQDGKLVVNTDRSIKALSHAVDLIHTHEITPEKVLASGADDNRKTFQSGSALFMRNWPYAVSFLNDDTPVTDKFDVTTMPKAEGHENADNSCLGGWSILVNDETQNEQAATEFAAFVGSLGVQELLALEYNRLPVRKELYSAEYYDKQPLLELFAEALQETRARPATPQYGEFSKIMYTNCNQALIQEKSPQQALNDAQQEIDARINTN